MPHIARWKAQHYRDMAVHFRRLAETEPLASLRRHLRRLAAQHEEEASRVEAPHASAPAAEIALHSTPATPVRASPTSKESQVRAAPGT
jgi:hypothetical protein